MNCEENDFTKWNIYNQQMFMKWFMPSSSSSSLHIIEKNLTSVAAPVSFDEVIPLKYNTKYEEKNKNESR